MVQSSGTGFFMPRSMDDVAPQPRMRSMSSSSSGTTSSPHGAHSSNTKAVRTNNKHFGKSTTNLGGTTASEERTATNNTFKSNRPSSSSSSSSSSGSLVPVRSTPSMRKSHIHSSSTVAVPMTNTSTTSIHSSYRLPTPGLIPAAASVCSSVQVSAGSNLQLTGACELPGAAVSSWDSVDLLGTSPAATSTISSSSCQPPFVPSAAAGSGTGTPVAAPESIPSDWDNTVLLRGLQLKAAVPAQDEVNPTDTLIPFGGSASLQTIATPQDMLQPVPLSDAAAAETLLQLHAKLAAAKTAATAGVDLCAAPASCTNLGGNLWGPGGSGSHCAIEVPSPTFGLFGGHNSITGVSSSALALSSSSTNTQGLLNGLPSGSWELGSSGSLFASSPTSGHLPTYTEQQVMLGNKVAASAAAVMAQEKLAQLSQLDVLRQQLRQDFMQLLPLI